MSVQGPGNVHNAEHLSKKRCPKTFALGLSSSTCHIPENHHGHAPWPLVMTLAKQPKWHFELKWSGLTSHSPRLSIVRYAR